MITQTIIDEAVKQSEKAVSQGHRYHHGSVIWKKNRIISKGYNKKRCVPTLTKYGYEPYFYPHSETDAILKADRDDLNGSSLLVIRKCKTKLGNSKPCSFCVRMVCECGIKKVFYSDTNGDIQEMRL
jgi:deoxycytidylate deaminase